ncbi:hypothetical protein AGMMS49992_24080 [Clostridia bacterium]|nr:hypothetical protein AGMMS49992_24080 [Clostridia bacterium]
MKYTTINKLANQAAFMLSNAERETVIRWDTADRTANVDTADAMYIRKLDRLCSDYPNEFQCTRIDDVFKAKRYTVRAGLVRFAKPPSQARAEAARRNNSMTRFKPLNTAKNTGSSEV